MSAPFATFPTPPGGAAFYGLAGEVVRLIEPETEADPAALLVHLLTEFGTFATDADPSPSIGLLDRPRGGSIDAAPIPAKQIDASSVRWNMASDDDDYGGPSAEEIGDAVAEALAAVTSNPGDGP